jgi:hypothetical protein
MQEDFCLPTASSWRNSFLPESGRRTRESRENHSAVMRELKRMQVSRMVVDAKDIPADLSAFL